MPNVRKPRKANVNTAARTRLNTRRVPATRPTGTKNTKNSNSYNISGSKRSPDTIISSLAASTSAMSMGSPYLDARLYCCAPTDSVSIPDGSSGKHFPVCLYSRDRISFAGTTPQSGMIQICPWLPNPIFLATGANVAINNVSAAGSRMGFGSSAQFAALPAVQQLPGNLSNAVDIYGATTCRIVAQTHSIRYTGPTQTCAGMILSWQNSVPLFTQGTVTATSATATPAPTTGRSVQVFDNTGAWRLWAPIGTEILTADVPDYVNLTSPAGTVCARPEQGMTIRLAHKGPDYEHVPFRNVPAAVIPFTGSTSLTNVNANNLTVQGPRGGTALCAFDNDWEGQIVSFENVNPDASFMVETCICVEFVAASTSPFYPVSRASPSKNEKIITTAERIITKQGTAVPTLMSMK